MNEDLYLAAGINSSEDIKKIKPLAEVERDYIEHVLALCRGNVQVAAEILEISPSTLYRKRARWYGDSDTANMQSH